MTSTADSHDAWRPVIAALADEEALAVFAKLVLGHELAAATENLTSKRRERVLRSLLAAGLLAESPGGSGEFELVLPFTALLSAAPVHRRTGVERFIKDGKLDRYPTHNEERREVLAWIAHRAIHPDEELSEAQLNERLKVFSRDYVTLRRYLVDFEILQRTPSGSSYALSK